MEFIDVYCVNYDKGRTEFVLKRAFCIRKTLFKQVKLRVTRAIFYVVKEGNCPICTELHRGSFIYSIQPRLCRPRLCKFYLSEGKLPLAFLQSRHMSISPTDLLRSHFPSRNFLELLFFQEAHFFFRKFFCFVIQQTKHIAAHIGTEHKRNVLLLFGIYCAYSVSVSIDFFGFVCRDGLFASFKRRHLFGDKHIRHILYTVGIYRNLMTCAYPVKAFARIAEIARLRTIYTLSSLGYGHCPSTLFARYPSSKPTCVITYGVAYALVYLYLFLTGKSYIGGDDSW